MANKKDERPEVNAPVEEPPKMVTLVLAEKDLDGLVDQMRDVAKNTAGDARDVAIRVLARLTELRGA